jgi:uncharacterized membrane-anchored protein
MAVQQTTAHPAANDELYWVTILAACVMGETVADFLSHGPMGLGYLTASLILIVGVIVALLVERAAHTPNAVRYWTVVVVMATAGTTIADFLSRTLELGYVVSTTLLAITFAGTFALWRGNARKSAGRPAEPGSVLPHVDVSGTAKSLPATDLRYWAAIMVASTLGTTLGDALSHGTELGFGGCALILFACLVGVLTFEYFAKTANEARYWTALVLASTIGATTGDWITHEEGLDLGYFVGTALVVGVFVVVVLIGVARRSSIFTGSRADDDALLPHVDLRSEDFDKGAPPVADRPAERPQWDQPRREGERR